MAGIIKCDEGKGLESSGVRSNGQRFTKRCEVETICINFDVIPIHFRRILDDGNGYRRHGSIRITQGI